MFNYILTKSFVYSKLNNQIVLRETIVFNYNWLYLIKLEYKDYKNIIIKVFNVSRETKVFMF